MGSKKKRNEEGEGRKKQARPHIQLGIVARPIYSSFSFVSVDLPLLRMQNKAGTIEIIVIMKMPRPHTIIGNRVEP